MATLDKERLYEEAQRRMKNLASLNRVSQSVASTFEVDQVLNSIMEQATELLKAEAGSVLLLDDKSDELVFEAVVGAAAGRTKGLRFPSMVGIAGWVLRERQPQLVPDVSQDRRFYTGIDSVTGLVTKSLLCVPLEVKGEVIGVLEIINKARGNFSKDDLTLLTCLASSAAIAIENAQLYQNERKRATQVELISGITQRIASILDLDQLLSQVVHLIGDTFGYYKINVSLIEADSDELILRAVSSPFESQVGRLRLRIGREGIGGWVAHSGEPLLVNDVGREPSYYLTEESKDTSSELAVPIKLKGEIIGVLDVQSAEPDAFSQDDVSILQTLADQLAVAIENARLYEAVRQELTERTQVEEALRQSHERYRTLFEHVPVGLYRSTPEGQIIDANPAMVELLGYPDQQSLLAVNTADLFVNLEDREQEHAVLEEKGLVRDYELQLRRRDGTVIWVQDTAQAVYGADGCVLYYEGELEDITGRKRAEKALERRVAQLALINDIGTKIAAELDLDEILDMATRLVQESFNYHHVALFLVDHEQEEAVLKAVAGSYAARIPGGYRLKLAEGMVGWTATHGRTQLANDVRTNPYHVRKFSDAMTQAELSVPIQASGETVGVLDIQSPQLDAFEESDVLVMEILADQIAVAIENARLFQEAQQRVQALTTLQEVSVELTDAASKPEDLLKMIVDSAVSTIPTAERGVIHLIDPISQELWPKVWSGIDNGAIGKTRMKVGEGVAGYAIDMGELVNVRDTSQDERFQRHPQSSGHCKSLLVAPMLIGSEKIGTISVDSAKANAFTLDDERLLRDLTTHAAYAIQNARLFNRTVACVATLEKLAESSKKLITYTDLDELFTFAAHQGAQIFNAEDCSLFVKDKSRETIHMVASSCVPLGVSSEYEAPIGSEPGVGLTPFVAATGQILSFVGDAFKNHSAWKGEFQDHLTHLPSGACNSLLMGSLEGSEGEIVGVMKLENKSGEEAARGFSEFDEKIFRTFASHVGIAIERARLFQKIAELARQSERERLREDLHDAMNSVHALIMLEAERILELVQARKYQEVENGLRALWKNAKFINFDQLGRLLEDMRAPILADKGLAVALQTYVRRIGAFEVQLDVQGRGRLPLKIEHVLYRIVQQALGNVAKHACLDKVENGKAQVTLVIESENVTLTIADNGVGFNVKKELEGRDALGLSVMRRWARSIDAQFDIISHPGKGTTVRVVVPLMEKEDVA